MRITALSLVLLALLAACSDPEVAAPAGALAGDAGLSGVVTRGSPLAISAEPALVPAGRTPVAGAEVRVLDIHGDIVGETATGADGAFLVGGVSAGYLKVEVRSDPASADPDVTAEVTGIAGVTIDVNRPYAISRQAAVDRALEAVPDDARVLGSLQPIPAGVTVTPAGPDLGAPEELPPSVSHEIAADAWLFFVDLAPYASFAHPVQYVLVDAESGEATRIEDIHWPPSVNGEGLWGANTTFFRFDGLDLDEPDVDELDPDDPFPGVVPEATAEVVQLPPEPQTETLRSPAVLQNHNVDPESIFAIIWQASPEPRMLADLLRFRKLLVAAGVPPTPNIRTIRSHREGTVDLQDSDYPRALAALNALIAARLEQGLHSTLVIYIVSHGGGGAFGRYRDAEKRLGADSVYAPELELTSTKACRVRVFLEFCYSRHFADELAAEFDALPEEQRHDYAIYAACARDEFSYSIPIELGFLTMGGKFTTDVLEYARVQNGDILGLLNPAGDAIRDELDSLLGTPFIFTEQNNFQHPSAIVRPNEPAWCRDEPLPPPTACVEEQEPNNVPDQAQPMGNATCAVGNIDAFTGDGVDIYRLNLAVGRHLARILGPAQVSAQVGDDFIPGTNEVYFVVTDPLVAVYLWVANGNGPYELNVAKDPQ